MTTASNRKQTKDTTSERNGTNDARQAGAIERSELPTYQQAVKARAVELWAAGYQDEARALIAREIEGK